MNLYRHEALKAEFEELKRKQNETNEKIHNPQFHELYLAAKVSQNLIDNDEKNRTGASVKARVIYEVFYNYFYYQDILRGMSFSWRNLL